MAPLDSDDDFIGREATEAQWCEVSERLAQATAKLRELEAHVEDLKEANLRLRNELGVATLALFITPPHDTWRPVDRP